MHRFGIRALGALTLAITAVAGVGHAASATTTDLLAGHGNFEKPAVPSTFPPAKTYNAGASFDGWKVTANKVSLVGAFPGIIVPPLGKQALTLDDALASSGKLKPGVICRAVPTIANHNYGASFKAGVGNSGTAQVVTKLGTSSKSVQLPAGARPIVFKPYSVTLLATTANAQLCVTTAKLGSTAFPTIDALKLVDLGPASK